MWRVLVIAALIAASPSPGAQPRGGGGGGIGGEETLPRDVLFAMFAEHARGGAIADLVRVRLSEGGGRAQTASYVRRWCDRCPGGPVVCLELGELLVVADRAELRVGRAEGELVWVTPADGLSAPALLGAHLPPVAMPVVHAALDASFEPGPWFAPIEWAGEAVVMHTPGSPEVLRLVGVSEGGRDALAEFDAATGRLRLLRGTRAGGTGEIELRFTPIQPGRAAAWGEPLRGRAHAPSLEEALRVRDED